MKVSRIVMAGLLLAACGGDDDAPPAIDRADIVVIDAGDPSEPDAGDIPACTAPEDLGTVDGTGAAASQYAQDEADPTGPKVIEIQTQLDDDAAPDILLIQFWDGYGPFSGGSVEVGQFTISGDDADFTLCGACVAIAANVTGGEASEWYVAESGTIDLTSITTNAVGSLTNVSLRHVQISGGTQTDDPSGCDSVITSMTFDAPITTE